MKIILRYRTCEIIFDETDPYYAGKTVELQGEALDDATFHVSKSEKLYWIATSPENPDRFIGIGVDDSDKGKLLSYIVKKAQEIDYKLILW